MSDLDPNCLFCKIIKGEVPSYTVFENDDVKAFLDIAQITRGHVLMVPKKHIVNFFDYTQADGARYLQYIPVIAQAIKRSNPKIKGMNISSNNGAVASQAVMHSHIHFIPRYTKWGDSIKVRSLSNADQYTEADYQEIAKEIRESFKK